jgi:hypothetical protein
MRTPNDYSFPERHDSGDGDRGSSDRVFGLVFTAFWSLVAAAPLRNGGSIRVWAAVLAATFFVSGLVRPSLLGPLNLQWHRFGRLLQKLTNPIAMAIVFFSTVTPLGLMMRLRNRDVLRLKWNRGAASYWIPRNLAGPRPASMKDQF